ncbi:uncharacterized protein SPSK_02732 [Sporothrix schenckii 1099-18]|uniref:Uncharacterized protein n=1 Tax=Sporothrix schenckii 1099-18 TaxID=1397361 RepID=A0A0F2MCM5_SPOSC|nr:uncharacterized protein SPSK_02732 [Sporothrix schenckii 1099-18]KJR86580.1 hypothetical protein SPSK_02732 [Sporothrix schenckii 1099-18]
MAPNALCSYQFYSIRGEALKVSTGTAPLSVRPGHMRFGQMEPMSVEETTPGVQRVLFRKRGRPTSREEGNEQRPVYSTGRHCNGTREISSSPQSLTQLFPVRHCRLWPLASARSDIRRNVDVYGHPFDGNLMIFTPVP